MVTTIAIAAAAAIAAGLAGLVTGAIFGSKGVSDVQRKFEAARESQEHWHRMWVKTNNKFNLLVGKCREIKVQKRGKGGRLAGMTTVWKLVEKDVENHG